jgi:integrase
MGETMPRGLHLLSAKQVEAAKPETTLNDGGGLFLRVSSNGTGRWVFRFKLPHTKQREMGLGTFGARGVTLALARQKAAAARQRVAEGLDPIAEAAKEAELARAAQQAEANALTFGAYADAFVTEKVKQFANPKHIYQWEHTFRGHVAALRDKKLADITRKDILAVLRPIWDTKHVTASRIRGRLENLFDHAIQNEAYPHDNPARWSLFSATLSAPRRQEGKGHQPALPRSEIPAFIRVLRERQATSMGALVLEFVVLAACRSGEARLARWGEFDLERLVWSIPKERMKMRRPHAVPLTPRMVEILSVARAWRGGEPNAADLVFPSQDESKPLSDMALLMTMRRLGASGYTVHGFRSAFRDWAGNETEFPRELAEEALAHALGGVERAYRREQAVERRRVMMRAWEDFVSGRRALEDSQAVVPFAERAAVHRGARRS